jgi:hypothetical protein
MGKRTPIRYVSNLLLASGAVLFTSETQAVGIRQFDKMANPDQSDHITAPVDGAQKVLIELHKDDLAAKIHELFAEALPGDKSSAGLVEFERNPDRARPAEPDIRRSDGQGQSNVAALQTPVNPITKEWLAICASVGLSVLHLTGDAHNRPLVRQRNCAMNMWSSGCRRHWRRLLQRPSLGLTRLSNVTLNCCATTAWGSNA